MAKAVAERRSKPKTGKELNPNSDKAIRFCDLYVVDFVGSHAAEGAGYSKRTARQAACKLLDMPEVQERIKGIIAQRAERTQTDQDLALNEIKLLALSDIGEAFDDNGCLKPLKDMPPHIRRCIASIEVDELIAGDYKIGHTKKLKLWDKKGTLELLGRHLKMFTDVVKVEGLEDLADELKAARERAAKR